MTGDADDYTGMIQALREERHDGSGLPACCDPAGACGCSFAEEIRLAREALGEEP